VAVLGRRGENGNVKTLRLNVDAGRLFSEDSQAALAQAVKILRAGGLVALPTETVYGLGANALDAAAVVRIFRAKKRPSWDPVIAHISGLDMLDGLVAEIPESARKLMEAFWPGPLTLLLPRSAAVPDVVTAGRPLVGVRMPAHPVALALIRQAGVPVAAPSANIFGHISPTTAAHVLDDLDGRIDAVLDAGPTEHGVESTVLDPCQSPMVIYRPGAVTAGQIRQVAGSVEIFHSDAPLLDATADESPVSALPSPGVGLRHYAPRAKLILMDVGLVAEPGAETGIEPGLPALARRIAEAIEARPLERVGLLLPDELAPSFPAQTVFTLGRWDVPEEMARELYAGLRALDAAGCTMILCPLPPKEGIGAAIRDRLRKAACADR
jgi:L-threonylcarbamoyladenylate synthase